MFLEKYIYKLMHILTNLVFRNFLHQHQLVYYENILDIPFYGKLKLL